MNLIKDHRTDVDKIYLYVKDSFESNYQLPINVRGKVEIKNLKNLKSCIDYSQTMMMFMKISKTIIQQRKREC